MVADLVVGFRSLKETFTSRVEKQRPVKIRTEYIEGPLKYLTNSWVFRPGGRGGTDVDFCVDFAFRNRIFEALAGQMFDRALRRMISAFEERARALYGPGVSESGVSSSSAQSAA
jgi:coenzyme Q-binding protein COQ10